MKGATLALLLLSTLLPLYSADAQTIFPNRGGTGTTTIPTAGQVLIGFPNGTYGPVATSSLGIGGGSGSGFGTSSIDTEAKLEAILTDVTNVLTNNDTTSGLTEGSNLYYTVARAQAALAAGYNAIFGNATATNATTTNLAVTGSINLLGTVITNVGTWFAGLFDTNFAGKDTGDLTEGSNQYFTEGRARAAISETVTGLDYSTSTGVLSATSGYSIPRTASTTEWATAYGWGNHASAGYLTGNQTITLTGDVSGSGATAITTTVADDSHSHTGSTLSGIDISADTNLAVSATGLQLSGDTVALAGGYSIPLTASTTEWAAAYATSTALTPAYIRGLFSSSATGLTYTAATGAFSLTGGYGIPLTASTTDWHNFFSTPAGRIAAGDALTWSGNTLNFDGGNSPGGVLGGTWASPTLDDNYLLNTGDSATGDYTFTGTSTLATTSIARLTVSGQTTLATTSAAAIIVSNAAASALTTLIGGNGATSLTTAQVGVGILGGGMNATDKYTPSLSFGSTDSAFMVTNPKFLASIAGYATETYASNIDSGMGLEFFTTPDNAGTTTTAISRMVIDQNGNIGIGTSTPTGRLAVQGASAGTVLQLFSNTGTKFFEMLNTGVTTLLGSWDFGGAAFLEIPNGTGPTTDDPGEIAHDTTDNQLILDDRVVGRSIDRLFAFKLSSSTPSFAAGATTTLPIERDGYTVTNIHCFTERGTSKAIILFGETITCGPNGTEDDGSIASPTVAALATTTRIVASSTSGSVDHLNISIFGNWSRK